MIRTENSENFKDKINEVTGVMAVVYGGDPSRRTPQAIYICPTREIAQQVLMQADMFLTKLTSMCKRSTEKGSMWVTMKRLSMKCQARLKKMASKGEPVEYRCLVCATDGKRNISTLVKCKSKFEAVKHINKD
ncbi:signal recognition particle 14 kDa protein-like [Triticum urartu]|uniref:signal recognition particle 14 kDa protein-like n=1 Tax=Triticum urartu TaxID=4572 RepID=UPI002042E4AB|nr:signal recognition particle 14 kDa protein-like [Triticum urartu]